MGKAAVMGEAADGRSGLMGEAADVGEAADGIRYAGSAVTGERRLM